MSTLVKAPLLSLPAELRNNILGNVLISQSPVLYLPPNGDTQDPELEETLSRQCGSKLPETNPPALFFVCRQLYNEVRRIYYGENAAKFVFSNHGYGVTIDTVCGRVTTQSGFQRFPLEEMRRVVVVVEILTEGDLKTYVRLCG